NKGEKVVETQWHNLVGWGRIADLIAQYVKKGTEIAIEGKLVNKSYTSKNGEKRYSTEIQINEILLLNDKSGKN
ncbi:MAG: single-stranded DNA-binding protein, partial [Chitinophagaceae bacterium]